MILVAAALAAARVVVPGGEGLSFDQRIATLAAYESRTRMRIESAIFQDPGMRAELRRVGFPTGCTAINETSREVIERHAPTLQTQIAQVIRKVIPAAPLTEARALSFLAMPLAVYERRVNEELEKSAAGTLQDARDDMRRTFLDRTKSIPTTSDPAENAVAPKPDVAAALGHKGNWDLDHPAQLGLACAELRISPQMRPTITRGTRQ